MTSLHVPLDYYAYGKVNSVPQFNQFASNMGIKDTSSNLLERNALSINSSKLEHLRGSYKQIHSLHESNPKGNNYMNPIQSFNSQEKYSIKPDMTNIETFRIARSKHFATDRSSDIQSGVKCTKEEFIQAKNDQVIGKHANLPCINETKKLNDNSLVFDKTNKSMIRYPKGFWGFCPEKMNRTKISNDAPQWFNRMTEKQHKDYNDHLIKNEETLSVFSRYQKWITVTPRSKNRRRPLEKMKVATMDETSKIMPKWMKSKFVEKPKFDNMKSSEYESLKNGKKFVILVDKNVNSKKNNENINKSVFSIGDYRHNVPYKETADFYSSQVSQLPKSFLNWNDGTKFNPKLKRDT